MTKIEMLTIGQSPRDDIIHALKEILVPDHEIIEAGALDHMTQEEIEGIVLRPDDYLLVSRLRDESESRPTRGSSSPSLEANPRTRGKRRNDYRHHVHGYISSI
jgi:protein AroM